MMDEQEVPIVKKINFLEFIIQQEQEINEDIVNRRKVGCKSG